MFLVLLIGFFALLHLPFFRKKKLWNEFKERAAWAMALSLLVMGALHFAMPGTFAALLPDYIPMHRELVLAGGGALVAGSFGMVWKKLRKVSSYGVVGLMASFLPANLQMAQDGLQLPGLDMSLPADHWLGWANVPLQMVYMFWAWKIGRRG